ncbi:transcriptional regulator, TetR family [[Clostridium] aminophilum]|uniref:Transcriptional regulator, TetR family n=1 Tax=[Clostridium] aminophilum TaxID=1526 RepID=A0A1I0HS58_9FIRM|nr:TetR/AcrR family transcriptional regulator [[Clostridium] aminophilum]SET85993.1 transcriptional regulator, TetR family [[Clostridium] aminophilum]
MSTKQRILDEALTLFAENGYDGTGVDLIAERVGIKGPSLYKHYKGKEEILNALIDAAEERYEEYFGSEKHIGKLPQSREEFIKVTMERISFTMRDPVIRKTRMLLVQEQFRNERISEVTTRHQLDGIQRMFAKIIKGMMDEGIVKNDDPELLAVELTAPAVLQIARSDRQPQYEEECMEYIEKHLRHFCKVYMRED